MKKNITYLFGAGASCKTLPILMNMPSAMEDQIDFIKNKAGFLNQGARIDSDEMRESQEAQYLNDLSWLLNKCKEHASVDTLARKLYINDHRKELLTLKNCLSVFLLIEQLRKQVDVRYDTFFATMLESKYKMPENLKIISWNYDMQFEMAYQAFINEKTLSNAQSSLGVHMKYNDNYQADGRFGIYKLNGSSIAYYPDNSRRRVVYSSSEERKISVKIIQDIFNNYCTIKNNPTGYLSGLSFAWEQELFSSFNTDILTIAKKHTANTEILVIVGYSIPFFNRTVDRDVICNMTNLKKVYFQDLNPKAVIERFNSIRDDISIGNLVPISNCDQFYVPNEM